jgi:hypothetical protein
LSLLTTVIRVARQCGLTPPSVVLGSGDETWLQFSEWAQEGVDDLALRHDWTGLHQTQTLTGDGATVNFNLAADYSRLSKYPAVSRNNSPSGIWPAGPLTFPSWIRASTSQVFTVNPSFRIEDGVLTFVTAPGNTEAYTVSYQSSKPITSSGAPTTSWTLDADTLIGIPERLLRLYLRWQWKEAKGLDYAKAEDNYERTLETLSSQDWGLMPQSTVPRHFMHDDADEFGDVVVVP